MIHKMSPRDKFPMKNAASKPGSKDLSIIDENEKSVPKVIETPTEGRKATYMQMTATAAARKEAITGDSKQFQTRRMQE